MTVSTVENVVPTFVVKVEDYIRRIDKADHNIGATVTLIDNDGELITRRDLIFSGSEDWPTNNVEAAVYVSSLYAKEFEFGAVTNDGEVITAEILATV